MANGARLRGPQSAGLLLGRKDLVKAAWVQSAPHQGHSRAMKVGREEMVAMLVAVENWVKRNQTAEWAQWVGWRAAAVVDPATWTITGGTWYPAHAFVTHPDYVDANWPFTADSGLVFLDSPVPGIAPAVLPAAGPPGCLAPHRADVPAIHGCRLRPGWCQLRLQTVRTELRFHPQVPPQRYNPSVGAVGTQDPMWLMLQNSPSPNHGGGCGGDSGSGVFGEHAGPLGDTVVAVHTGGYRMGFLGRLCGRMTSLNHRVDLPVVLDWIAGYLD